MRRFVTGWACVGGEALPQAETPQERKDRRMMSDSAVWAGKAIEGALASSGFADPLAEVAMYFGVGSSTGDEAQLARMLAACEGDIGRFCADGLRQANPLFAFQLMNNFTMCHPAIRHGFGGPNSALFSRGFGTCMALKFALRADATTVVGGADCCTHPINLPDDQHADGAAALWLDDDGSIAVSWLDDEPPAQVVLTADDFPTLGAAGPAFAWVRACELIDAGNAEVVDVDWLDEDGQRARVRFANGTGPVGSRRSGDFAVITGFGVVSPFGHGVDAMVEGLRTGRVPVGPITLFDAAALDTVAAQVPGGPSPITHDRKVGFALDAAREALAMAGIERPDIWTHLGLGLEVAFLEAFDAIRDGEAFRWEDGDRLRSSVDDAARAVRDVFELSGPMSVNVSACAAGAMAIAEAAELVRNGDAEVVLTGGADSMLNPMGLGGMARLGAPSPDACRPFDTRRNGLVMGEGAALFVVESEASARARGATILARILGSGTSQDGYRVTAPRPDGSRAAAAITAALIAAGIDDVDWVCAHGTGTPLNDPAEVRAIASALRHDVPISSIKGATGHLMAAAGALEAAASVVALRDQFIPGTPNLDAVDLDCVANIVRGSTDGTLRVVASTSFGFGGQNCCLILGAP